MDKSIEEYCELTQDSLWERYWNEQEGFFVNRYPLTEGEHWCYWWNSHAIDTLLDGYLRTKNPKYLDRIKKVYEGVYKRNGNSFLHNWYDDMEWMALAQLRLWGATEESKYKKEVLYIWDDIKTAWNEHMGGGLAWKKDQLDYKNTPANGPAAILAFRLYQRFGNEEDLQWGNKILDWNRKYLVDPENGFVWDGINREGDGKIDYDWKFTYCQGVIVGALVEKYNITKEPELLNAAIQTVREGKKQIADPHDGIFPCEGKEDCGLFKGIYMRYVYELVQICPELDDLRNMIIKNAKCVIEQGINKDYLIGGDWKNNEQTNIDLAQHLSGVMLLEMAAKLS